VKKSSFWYLPLHNTPVSLSESHPNVYVHDSWERLCTLWAKRKGWRKSFHNWDKWFSMRYVLTLRKHFCINQVTQHNKSWWQQSNRCN